MPRISLTPSTMVIGSVAVVATTVAVLLMLNLVSVLITVFLAVIWAEAIRPTVRFLRGYGVPRPLAVASIYLTLFAFMVGSLALILPPLSAQFMALTREAPSAIQEARSSLPELNAALHDLGLDGQLQSALGQLASQATPLLRAVALLPVQILGAAITVFSGFILAAFWIGFTEDLNRGVIQRLAPARRELLRSVAADLSITLGGWLRGQLILMLFVGSLSFVALLVLGIKYPVPLAVFAGITEAIPLVGPWIGAIPAILVAAVSEGPGRAGVVALIYLAIQQIENNLLVPKIMQQAIGLHPFVVLVALLVGGSLLGVAGVIISLPMAAMIQVLFTRLWLPHMLAPSEAESEGENQSGVASA